MWFNLFRRRSPGGPIRLKPEEPVAIDYVVLAQIDGDAPSPESLTEIVGAWVPEHVGEPIGPHLTGWIERGLLQCLPIARQGGPPLPPVDLLRHFGVDDEQERRYESATHMVLLRSFDRLKPPRLGLWAARAAARAIAEEFTGVIFDPALLKLHPIDTIDAPIPVNGGIHVTDHLVVPFSVNQKGLGWITTKGMSRFGLPELEVRDVPPDLPNAIVPIVNGVAAALVRQVHGAGTIDSDKPMELQIGPEIRLETEDVARAYGEEPPDAREGVRGWTSIGLELHRGRRGSDDFLRLVPPAHFPHGQGVWLHSLLSDLFGASDHEVRGVSADSEAMARAHARAVGTLPAIKRRFQKGLELGERLLVKHGFPTTGDGHEYMWVVVNTWAGERIRGQLANDPEYRVDLRAGQTVDLADADVFDWYLTRADGGSEGGFTNQAATESGRILGEDAETDD